MSASKLPRDELLRLATLACRARAWLTPKRVANDRDEAMTEAMKLVGEMDGLLHRARIALIKDPEVRALAQAGEAQR